MTTQVVRFSYDSGVAGLTATVYGADRVTVLQSGLACTETGTGTEQYTFSVTAATGSVVAWVVVLQSGSDVGGFYVNLPGTAGTYDGEDSLKLATLAMNSDGTLPNNGLGSGAYTIAITVTDSLSNPLQHATVSAFLNSLLSADGTTDVSGHVTFALNAATYTLNVTCNGYNSSSQSLVVSANASVTVALTALTITPSSVGETTGWLVAYDEFGNTLAGCPHIIRLISAPSAGTGASYSPLPRTVISDSNGLVTVTGHIPNAKYSIIRGTDGSETTYIAGSTTFQIPDLIGRTQ